MKKKVLFLIDSLGGGGAERVLITLLNKLDKHKYSITLTTIVNAGVYTKHIPDWINYEPILTLPKSKIGKVMYSIKYKLIHKILPLNWVYRLYVPQNNEIEIAFVEGFCTRLLSYSTNKKSRKIAWVHTDLINNHWIKRVYRNTRDELRCYKKYDRIIGVSDNVVNSIRVLYGLENVSVIHNPINSDLILKQAMNGRRGSTTRLRLVSTGRLVKQKGYDRLLKIFKRLLNENFDIELLILGEGEDREMLQKYIELHELQNRVLMPGFVENPYAEMGVCDIFVCSSRSEGYSTAVTEALILGIPVVTTNCSGMKELLGQNNEYGIVTENNEEALYQGLKELIVDEEKQSYYKRMAYERSKDFSIDKLIRPIEYLFES